MKLMPVELTDTKKHDKTHTQSIANGAGDLFIWNLGYFNILSFAEMQERESSFLSRMHGEAGITEISGEPFYFTKLYTDAKIRQKTIDIEVSAGLKKKFAKRLVVELVTEEEYRMQIAPLEMTIKR